MTVQAKGYLLDAQMRGTPFYLLYDEARALSGAVQWTSLYWIVIRTLLHSA